MQNWGRGICELSVCFVHFCWDPKTALNKFITKSLNELLYYIRKYLVNTKDTRKKGMEEKKLGSIASLSTNLGLDAQECALGLKNLKPYRVIWYARDWRQSVPGIYSPEPYTSVRQRFKAHILCLKLYIFGLGRLAIFFFYYYTGLFYLSELNWLLLS